MLKLNYGDVYQSISKVMDDELADTNVIDDLAYLLGELDRLYRYNEIKVAMDTPQSDPFLDDDYNKLTKEFKKMDKKVMYDIVSRVSFMAGIAHAEWLRIEREKRIRRNERN